MTPSPTAAALLLVLCCCGSAFGSFSQKDSSLAAVWSKNGLEITQLYPTTGAAGKELFTSTEIGRPQRLSPALDHHAQRLFVPLSSMLGVFDLSVPGKATLLKTIPTPGVNIFSMQYDPVKDTVWLVTDLSGHEIRHILVSVNLTSGTAKNVIALPAGYRPAFNTGLGAPSVMDEKNRELVLSVKQIHNQNEFVYSLLKFNLDSQQFTILPCPDLWPSAMAKDVQSGTVYALFKSRDYRQPLSFGTVDTTSGKLELIKNWTDTSLLFVQNSICAFDPVSDQFYALVNKGDASPAALVTVSAKSGELKNVARYLNYKSPYGFFVF